MNRKLLNHRRPLVTTDELTSPRIRNRMAVVVCLAVIAAACLHCATSVERAEVPGFYNANHKCGVDLLSLHEDGVYVRYTRMPDGQEHCDTALWTYSKTWDSLGVERYLVLDDWVVYWVPYRCDNTVIPTQPWEFDRLDTTSHYYGIEKWLGMVRFIIVEDAALYYIKVEPDTVPDSLLQRIGDCMTLTGSP